MSGAAASPRSPGTPEAQTVDRDSVVQLASRFYADGEYQQTASLPDPADTTAASPIFFYYKGMSFAALYDYLQAQKYLLRACREDSLNVPYRFQYGRILIQSGFPDEAVEELSACITLDSSYIPACFQLALLYNSRKTAPHKEAEIFSYLVRRNPNDFLSLYYLGDALRRLNLDDSGITFIERSIESNPRYFPSIIALAHDRHVGKKFPEALELYHRAEALRPRDKDLLFQLGECLRKMNRNAEAAAYFNRSIAIDSTNDAVYGQLGVTYFALGKYDSSIAAYERAIALDGENVLYYSNIALVYRKIDSVQCAIDAYKKAIEVLHPENISFAYNNLAAFYFGRNMPEAAEAYGRVYEYNPENLGALRWRAQALEAIPDVKAAIAAYERLFQLLPGDAKSDRERTWIRECIERLRKKKQ